MEQTVALAVGGLVFLGAFVMYPKLVIRGVGALLAFVVGAIADAVAWALTW